MILSKDAMIKIGSAQGRYTGMDKRRLILEEELEDGSTNIHYVPIKTAINSTITGLGHAPVKKKR
jgi:hypothetical protein